MLKNIDLTQEIQQFSDLVLKAASATGNYKPSMIVRPLYVRRKDLTNWIPEEEVTKGNKYVSGRALLLSQQLSQKELKNEKTNSSNDNFSTKSQPSNSTKFESCLTKTSSLPLVHSNSCPNMEGKITFICQ